MEKLYDAELKVMEIIWADGEAAAKDIAAVCSENFGWNKNTTYTVIKRLVEKKVLSRSEPGFICSALIGKNEVQKAETKGLIEKLFEGSKSAFFAAFADEKLSPDEIEALKALIEKK